MRDRDEEALRRSRIRECLTVGVDFEQVKAEEEKRREALRRLSEYDGRREAGQ